MQRLVASVIWLMVLAFAGHASAAESAPVVSPRARVSLVSETDSVAPSTRFRIGLRFQLADGWHTYWKNPGDAGVAPELTLDLPAGTRAGEVEWPAPRRLAEGPIMTYGYLGQVLLTQTVTPPSVGGPMVIKAHATWLVCKDLCVPEEGDFRLELPGGAALPSPQAPLFAAHDRAVPRPSPWQARVSPDGALFVQGPELNSTTVVDAWFVPDASERIQHDAAQPLSVRAGGFVLALRLAQGFDARAGLTGVLSLRDRSGQQTDVELHAVPGPPPPPVGPPLLQVLGFAFLGGLILNLMPCVFPILAMKAVGFAAGAAHGRARAHAVSYTAGVLVTFTALALALLAARAGGSAAGWGFQFASPAFVTAMSWLLFVVGLNLSGVFEVGHGLTGIGGRVAARHGHLGSFFTGLLAVLVATPCTAPFMGVAVAAALAAPPLVTVLVFLAMGLGLASPYAALASVPGLARYMPRPGRWMELLRQGLAFPMYGAAVWLLWVVSQESGSTGVLATAAGFVLLGFAGWVWGLSQGLSPRGRRFGQASAVMALLLTLAVLSGSAMAPPSAAAHGETDIEAFTPARLAALRAAGQPVFVNITAAWCVTCLVNERVAIGTGAVQQAFGEKHVAYLKGDWTRQDPALTAYLRENGRDGVPLYVFYPAGNGLPVMLPQILTEGAILGLLRNG